MSRLATTKLSSKGQIVIPEEIRDQMGFHTGDQFLIVAEKGVVILKMIEKPEMGQFKDLITKTRKLAKSSGLTPKALSHAIKTARKK